MFGASDNLTVFTHAGDHALKKSALRLVPKGMTLARVAISWPEYGHIFNLPGPPRVREHRLDTVVLTEQVSPRFNAAVRSNVQFLGAKGWR